MEPKIDRKPTFPIDAPFLDKWKIQKPIFCLDSYEVYRLQDDVSFHLGLVIRSDSQEKALLETYAHATWFQLLAENRIKVVSKETRKFQQWYLSYISVLLPENTKFLDEEERIDISQQQAVSLFLDLASLCRSGLSKKLLPIFDSHCTLFSFGNEDIYSVPLFVDYSDCPDEAETIKKLSAFIYFILTGIKISEPGINAKNIKNVHPPAIQWNKNIDQRFSDFIDRCLGLNRINKNKNHINSLDELENELRKFSLQHSTLSSKGHENEVTDCKDQLEKDLHGLEKVAGMTVLKGLLEEVVIHPIQNPSLFKKYGLTVPNGILLFGPPGCGKTFIARQLAEEIGWNFMEVKGSDVGSVYIHGSALAIRNLFAEAETSAPTMIFIDEFEGLVPKRSNLGDHQQFKSEEVNEFLVHLDGCSKKEIFVIAATNEPHKIDVGILRTGRMDKMIYVGPPDLDARKELLKMYFLNRPMSITNADKFAEVLEGYSCSDIKNITDEAARLALREGSSIEEKHIEEAIRRNPSSLSLETMMKYEDFQQRGI